MSMICAICFSILLNAAESGIRFTPEEQAYLSQKKEITMCADPDWEPFEVITKEGKHEGISADLIQLAAKRMGVKITLVPTQTWEETLAFSKSKKCEIMSFVNQTPEREKWLIFTQPLLSDPNVMITREEHPFIGDVRGLDQERVVLPSGTMVLEKMRKEFPNLIYIPVVSEPDAMKMVSEKKADITVRSLIVAGYIIKKEGWFNLKIAGRIEGFENHLRIGVAKDEPILRDILDKGIRTITPVERAAIVNKHAGLIVKEGLDYKIVTLVGTGVLGLIGLVVLWNFLLHRKVRSEVAKNLAIKEQLYQKAKQAEIGNLIANISHQWREPLSKLSSINLLVIAKIKMGQSLEREWIAEQAQKIEDTISFMSHTMQNFLEFYKQSTLKTDFSAYESIQSALTIIETKILDQGIRIEIEGNDVVLNGVKNEWMQIWLNLLNNAVHVFSERKCPDPTIRIVMESNQIRFCDNGGGMDLAQESHGLGIPMCREILSKYNAVLHLENTHEGLCAAITFRA